MRTNRVAPEDLDVLARRGQLPLDALREEPLAALGYRVGIAFDEVADVCGGDEERIFRSVERVLQEPRCRRVPGRRRRATWLLAALALITTSGMAWIGRSNMSRPSTQARSLTVSVPRPSAVLFRPRVALRGSGIEATASAPEPPPAPASVPQSQPALLPDGMGAPEGVATASMLLARANKARGRGAPTEAIELYRLLQRHYPGSAEARLSRVSLGRILLGRGQQSPALAEFDEYLKGGGALEEEALVGRAHALSALGRNEAELACYQVLLDRFPRSVYAREAQARLGERDGER